MFMCCPVMYGMLICKLMLDFVAFFYVSHINASEKCFFAENENNFNMYANVYITNQQGRNEKKK